MQRSSNTHGFKYYFILHVVLWIVSIVVVLFNIHISIWSLTSVFYIVIAFVISLKIGVFDRFYLNSICDFYAKSHAIDELQLINKERPYKKILDSIVEIGNFDWAILFLINFENNRINAVEKSGVCVEDISFDGVENINIDTGCSNSALLSKNILDKVFNEYQIKGAVASASIERNESYYGCLLVGRDTKSLKSELEDALKLDILSDQLAVCMHNYQMHKELSIRTEQLSQSQRQLQTELEIARIVQDSVMPRKEIECQQVNLKSFIQPARTIGGDFLWYAQDTNGKQVDFLIGDVCGKGIPAALVMAVVVCMFKEKHKHTDDPASLMSHINQSLKDFLGAGSRFNSTALYAKYDVLSRTLCYCSAGHDFPLLYSPATNKVTALQSTGTLLGIFAESNFENRYVNLEKGDKILFYSDGLTDFFEQELSVEDGFEYLTNFLLQHSDLNSEKLVATLKKRINKCKLDIKDDVSIAVLEIEG